MNIKRITSALTAGFMMALAVPTLVSAASNQTVNFEAPTYTPGNIDGQDGWSKTGPFDVEVEANTFGFTSFNGQTLRISNSVTSGSFGDQTFSKSLADEAGETSAQNGGLSTGPRESRFEASFDLATTLPTEQPGLIMSTSPDRGDGARMSYLRFEDKTDGVHVFFSEYKDNAPLGVANGDANGCAAEDLFTSVDIATVDRTAPHNIKFVIDFVDGTHNDIVKVYVDGTLKTTGGSWEDYFRYCEGNETRTVDSLLFRVSGTAAPLTAGQGFLVDNLNLKSSETPTAPALTYPDNKDDCKDGGWQTFTGVEFKNQGQCVSYVNKLKTTSHSLNSNNPAGLNVPTVDGSVYKVTVSGTWANRPGEVVDAECTSWQGAAWANSVEGGSYSPNLLDVQVNEAFVEWGDCADNHSYTRWVTADDASMNLRVFDGDTNTNQQIPAWFGDNVGALAVKVTKYPQN